MKEDLQFQLQLKDNKLQSKNEELQTKEDETRIQLFLKDREINRLRTRYVQRLRNPRKNHVLVIYDKNNPIAEIDPLFLRYYCIRVQLGSLQKAEDEFIRKFEGSTIIFRTENPNPITAFNHFKESGLIEFHGNHFRNVTEFMRRVELD